MAANECEFEERQEMKRAAIGIRMHSGWGALVVMSDESALEVVDRRHIVVAEAGIPGSKQPYHYVERSGLKVAEKYLANCSAASGQLASVAVGEIVEELDKRGYRVWAAVILMASGRALPSLAQVLASHALIHAAEGEFFRTIVRKACEDIGIAVTPLREREVEQRAREVLGTKTNQTKQRISRCGKRLGPPWTQDEKIAALAATLILRL
jgi:nucleoside diphosphate kinase